MPFLRQFMNIFKAKPQVESLFPIFRGKCITGPGKPKGQDAFFVTDRAFGVADGVGGWLDAGIDSGYYASALCLKLSQQMTEYKEDFENVDLCSELIKANDHVKNQNILGSTTLCYGLICEKSLKVFNVGDSSIMLCKPDPNHKDQYIVQARTPTQTHYFNCPYQLGDDHPTKGQLHEYPLQPRSIIIAATDGLYDNLFETRIIEHISDCIMPQSNTIEEINDDLDQLTQQLIEDAYEQGQNPHGVSPFSIESGNHGYDYLGGKPDDITVIAGMVVDKSGLQKKKTTDKNKIQGKYEDKEDVQNKLPENKPDNSSAEN